MTASKRIARHRALAVSANPSGDFENPKSRCLRYRWPYNRQKNHNHCRAFYRYFTPFIFSGALLSLLRCGTARCLSPLPRFSDCYSSCVRRTSNGGASRYGRIDRIASDALSERRGGKAHMPKLLHWGYTIDHPTVANVTK